MNFKDITENVTALPDKTSGVMEKLKEFYTSQLPQPFWDEDSQQELPGDVAIGAVSKVTDDQLQSNETNAMGFDVRIPFTSQSHAECVREVAGKIKELGAIGLDIKPTRNDFYRPRKNANGTVSHELQSTAMYFRDGQGYGMAVVSTWDVNERSKPTHELHFRRRPRPH